MIKRIMIQLERKITNCDKRRRNNIFEVNFRFFLKKKPQKQKLQKSEIIIIMLEKNAHYNYSKTNHT